jgi:hypothetical protein
VDYRREQYDPPLGEIDDGRWQVHFAGEPTESEAIQRAASTVMPGEHIDIHTDVIDGCAGDVTVAIRVYAQTRDKAVEDARFLLRKIRAAAGLPPAETRTLGHISPWWKTGSLTRDIAEEALELHRQGRHELAIIRTHTACEIEITHALTSLLTEQHPHADPKHLIQRRATLRDDASRALLHLLTGRRIQDEFWWTNYIAHIRRRNEIVHQGVTVTHDDADESMTVSLELRRWLLEARGAEHSNTGQEG